MKFLKQWGCHICCRWLVCRPTFCIQYGWFKEAGGAAA